MTCFWCSPFIVYSNLFPLVIYLIQVNLLECLLWKVKITFAWIYSVCNLVINHFLGFPIFDISYAQNGKFSFHFSHFHCHLELNKHLFLFRTWLGWTGNECVKDCKPTQMTGGLNNFEILTHAKELLHVSFFLFFFPYCLNLFFVVHCWCLALMLLVAGGFLLYVQERNKKGSELVWIIFFLWIFFWFVLFLSFDLKAPLFLMTYVVLTETKKSVNYTITQSCINKPLKSFPFQDVIILFKIHDWVLV